MIMFVVVLALFVLATLGRKHRGRRAFLASFAALAALGGTSACGRAAEDATPQLCTPDVNARVGALLAAGGRQQIDNVLVCGTTISSSRTQRGGVHGDHQVLPLRVLLPDGRAQLIEVVTNDALDGRVTAPAHATVFAYGQFYMPARGAFVGGIHDVHCATHRGADNGWVAVNGARFPAHC